MPTTDQEEWVSLVKEINQGADLTAWEADFIDDMLKMIDKQQSFSLNQGKVIEDIYRLRIG